MRDQSQSVYGKARSIVVVLASAEFVFSAACSVPSEISCRSRPFSTTYRQDRPDSYWQAGLPASPAKATKAAAATVIPGFPDAPPLTNGRQRSAAAPQAAKVAVEPISGKVTKPARMAPKIAPTEPAAKTIYPATTLRVLGAPQLRFWPATAMAGSRRPKLERTPRTR